MKLEILATSLACSLIGVAQADPIQAGRLAEWSGGTAVIQTYGHDGAIGSIKEDGTVLFDLPPPELTGQTIAETFDYCSTGGLKVENGAAQVAATMLYVEHNGSELGMVAATSPELAAWSLSYGQTPQVEGAHLRWFYVDGEASVDGVCLEEVYTASGPTAVRLENRLNFVKGWNLVRTTFLEILEQEDGPRLETHTINDALQVFPDDAVWYLSDD